MNNDKIYEPRKSPIDEHEEQDEFEKEYQEIKKQKEASFNLNIESKISSMPDYLDETKTASGKVSVFARVMFAVAIVGISVFLSLIIIFSTSEILAINKPDRPIVIDVPENIGVKGIADLLEERKVIDNSFVFKVYFKLFAKDVSLNYGTFDLNSNMPYDAIINSMARYSSAKNEVTVTFPEGLTIYEMAKKLETSGVCKAKDFMDVLNEKTFGYDFETSLSKNPLKFHKLEGFVFPDTYNFYKDDVPYNVAKKLIKQFDTVVNDEIRQKMKNMGYTLEQTLTIASIVQKEAGKTEEMRKVASVYHNRLNNKDTYPNLQACPTRDYANELKKQMDVIDQTIIDAYNTYEDVGLPPGPICNPGIDAIMATLDPEQTDYFYFCTGSDGQFYYGKTLAEHEKNIRKAGLV